MKCISSNLWVMVTAMVIIAEVLLSCQPPGVQNKKDKLPAGEEVFFNRERLPLFGEFPVSELFKGKTKRPDFSSSPKTLEFLTAITEGVKKGPNFAGHFTIVTWGCGTACQSGVIVDVKTGTIYLLSFTAELGLEFRIDSKLLIVNPPSAIKEVYGNLETPNWVHTTYYIWENNQLVILLDTRNK